MAIVPTPKKEKIVEFLRRHDYKMLRELGQGACGKTVLLYDPQIEEHFVCKKYVPYAEEQRQELYRNFVREIKLLHRVFHRNVVRVFNYYLYPDNLTGYILMEYVEGNDVEKFLTAQPEKINDMFVQAISGFQYLESNKILHRDIRSLNIMVGADDILKIIDLGFGKRIDTSADFEKSVDLNLWCEAPKEFENSIYDYTTEVYFVGKLFAKVIEENEIDCFNYRSVLSRMCHRDPQSRISSFFDVAKELGNDQFNEIEFSRAEMKYYRDFADALTRYIPKIDSDTKYKDDVEKIENELDNVYRSCMLEQIVPDSSKIVRCFLDGAYYYKKDNQVTVLTVRTFLSLLKTAPLEKKRILLANLFTRLDAIPRYSEPDLEPDDDIPF